MTWISFDLVVVLHLAAFVLAIVFWRRMPFAAALVMVSSTLNLVVTVARVFLLHVVRDGLPDGELFGNVMPILSLVNLVAYGLMIWAVFAGRSGFRPVRPVLDVDDSDRPAPPPASAGSTGIQEKP